jgi:hypothetical protein
MTTTTLPTAEELAEKIKTEVVKLVVGGVIPKTVKGFSELHDYVDANCLGGTEAMWDALPIHSDGEVDGPARDALLDVMNGAMDRVDAWIKAGALGK